MQTKITQLLDSKNTSYKLLPHSKAVFTCDEAAKVRGVKIEEMIKVMVVKDKKNSFYVACLLAPYKLDTNKLRAVLNSSRLSFATKEEIQEVLGYTMGAIPPLLFKNPVPLIFDEGIKQTQHCNISSGNPEAGIELPIKDLIDLANPKFADIAMS